MPENETVEDTPEVTPEATTEAPTAEVQTEEPTENVESEEVITNDEINSILDKLFEETKESTETTETKKVGPQIDEVQVSESEALLNEVNKELDAERAKFEEVNTKANKALTELETLKSEQEEKQKEIEELKEAKESAEALVSQLEEFYSSLNEVPYLGDLVTLFATKGKDAVNINSYLKEMVDSRIAAQSVSPTSEASVPPSTPSVVDGLKSAILRRNKL